MLQYSGVTVYTPPDNKGGGGGGGNGGGESGEGGGEMREARLYFKRNPLLVTEPSLRKVNNHGPGV